jgi:hypothetical protein
MLPQAEEAKLIRVNRVADQRASRLRRAIISSPCTITQTEEPSEIHVWPTSP